jgi:hypothetical protein
LEQNPKLEYYTYSHRLGTSTYFLFNGKFYEQKDGVAMGSTLAPTVTNYFMEDFEHQALNTPLPCGSTALWTLAAFSVF